MITGWLAGKLSGMIIFCIACTAPVLLVGAIILSVQLNGMTVPVFGWRLSDGYIQKYEADEKALVNLRSSNSSLSHGIDTCNMGVENLKTAGDLLVANANMLAKLAEGGNKALADNVSAMKKIKSTDEKCPVADAIIERAFQ